MGRPAEFRPGISTCSDCGTALVDTVEQPTTSVGFAGSPRPPGKLPWPKEVVVAGLVSLVAAAIAPILSRVTLPYIDGMVLDDYFRYGAQSPAFADLTSLSVVAIGITPWLTALFVVELAALVVPRWRPLREVPEGRARLQRAGLIGGVLVALAQSWMMVEWLSGMSGSFVDSVAPELWATGPRLVVVATLVAATCLLRLVVGVVERHGLGNGFVVVIAGSLVATFFFELQPLIGALQYGGITPLMTALSLAVALVPAAVAWRFVRPLPRADDVDANDPAFVPRPSAGVIPAEIATWIPGALVTVATWLALDREVANALSPVVSSLIYVVTGALLVPLFAALFASASRLAVAQARLAGRSMATDVEVDRARLAASAALPATLLVNGAVVAAFVVENHVATIMFYTLGPVTIAMLAKDLIVELRARRAQPNVSVGVWQFHRFDLVAPALAALRSENIAAFARSAHYRALFHFFAPWAPVEIVVDAEHAERAHAIVRALATKACTTSQG